MDAKQIEGFLAAARALVEMATQLGRTMESLIEALKPEPIEAEFGPCMKCGVEGPTVTYRAKDGTLKRITWCGKCSIRQ
jgi:hypothetical protein